MISPTTNNASSSTTTSPCPPNDQQSNFKIEAILSDNFNPSKPATNSSSNNNKKHLPPPTSTTSSSLSMDRAAFLLIRIKRVFQKKKRKNQAKSHHALSKKQKPPMSRARTLPAIITPALNILQVQLSQNKVNVNVDESDHQLGVDLNETSLQVCYRNSELLPNGTSGKSELISCSCPNCGASSNSPRQSISSNSSAGSASKESSNKTKNSSFQKLTKLLSNNSNRILSTSYGGLWPKGHVSNQFNQDDNHNHERSCFAWNTGFSHHKHEQAGTKSSKNLKRIGSVDSLLSIHHSQFISNRDEWKEFNDSVTFDEMSSMDGTVIDNYGTSSLFFPYTSYWPNKSFMSNKLSVTSGSKNKNETQSSTYYLSVCSPDKRHLSIDINSVPVMDASLKKSERKRLEKLSKFNFDQQALFSAVENEHFERTRMIIESTNVDVNRTNSDGFTSLDISLMLLNMPLIKYLQSCGAREGDLFNTRLSRELHLQSLLNEAERCLLDLSTCLHRQSISMHGPATSSIGSSTSGSGLSSALVKEKERQLMFWQRRLKLLQRLKKGFDLLQPPPPPLSVHVQVAGAESLLVHYYPPIRLQDRRQIITKYKIEWSMNQFDTIIGFVEVTNLFTKHEFVIRQLESEQCYQVRIASGNCKGYSEYCYPLMNQSVPSTWRSIDKKHSRMEERVVQIEQLFEQIADWRQQQMKESHDKRRSIELEQTLTINCVPGHSTTTSGPQKKVRKSIRNFFGATNKFQKAMKRGGIYLASLVYHDQRVLITNEEVLPLIEIDDIYPSTLQNDFYWLLKISCTWEDVKMFRKEMEKSQSSSVAHFRTKILLAIEQMQSSLGFIDLGKLYYKPLRDSEGSVVLCTICCLEEPKMVSCLSVRWLPLTKLQKRAQTNRDSGTISSERVSDSGISVTELGSPPPRLIGDILFSTLYEMIQYHQACNTQLPRGLYIAYVKLKSSVDLMSLMVAKSHPNILPYAKIRDNPHVSRQEWAALKMCLRPNDGDSGNATGEGNNSWRRMVTSASQLQLQLTGQSESKQETRDKDNRRRRSKESQSSPSCSSNFLNPPTVNTVTPLASPIAQTGPGFVENFFQLACQHQQEWQLDNSVSQCADQKEQHSTQNVDNQMSHRLTFEQKLSFQQLIKFLQMLSQTSGHFLQSIGVNNDQHLNSHRLYTVEVIELDSHISLILLLPPPDEVCSVTQCDDVNLLVNSGSDLIYLPLKIFELIHMNTYQKRFTGQYWRISALLELDITAAQQAQREAFSSSEVTEAKTRLNQLLEFQTQLDEHCRSMRWIMDVVAYARDRQISAGIALTQLQHCLSSIDKEMWKEEEEDRLWNIPAISFSAPNDFVPKINIQSECNSTPSSPPATIIVPSSLGRRKSRDDSYLEQHHRAQNHFHSLAHQRFHHSYHSCGSKDDDDYDPSLEVNLDQRPEQSLPTQRSASLQPSSLPSELAKKRSDNRVDVYCSSRQTESSYSLTDSPECRLANPLEDTMRRCLSTSRLVTSDIQMEPDLLLSFKSHDIQCEEAISNKNNSEKKFDDYLSVYQSEKFEPSSSYNMVQYCPEPCITDHNEATKIFDGSQIDEKSMRSGSITNSEFDPYRPLSRITHNVSETKIEEDPQEEEDTVQQGQVKNEKELLLVKCQIGQMIWNSDQSRQEQTTELSFISDQPITPVQDADPLFFKDNFEDVLQKSYEKRSKVVECHHLVPSSSGSVIRVIRHQTKTKSKKKMRALVDATKSRLFDNLENRSKKPQNDRNNRRRWNQPCCSECCRATGDCSSCNTSSSSNSSSGNGDHKDHQISSSRYQDISGDSSRDVKPGNDRIVDGKILQLYIAQECCLPQGTLVELEVTLETIVNDIIQAVLQYSHSIRTKTISSETKKKREERTSSSKERTFDWRHYSLLAVYSGNIKHLNNDFQIGQLQSPWDNARLCLHYNRC